MGGSEFGIKLPIPLLGNLLCFVNCDSSNGDQPTRPPHDTSQTYQILGIQLINGQRSVVYPSIEAAVRAAQAPAVNRFRTNGRREAYGYVFPSGNGFKYSGPFDSPGEFGGHVDVPPGIVASYHTHSQSAYLSKPTDEDFLHQTGKPLYILTVPSGDEPAANGGIFRYMPGKPEEPYMLP